MFQSLLALYQDIPTWVGIVADVCTILAFVGTILHQNKRIKDLELKVINTNNNSNSLEHIENKIVGYGIDDVIKLYNEIKDKDIGDKYVEKEIFSCLVDIVGRLTFVVSQISEGLIVHNEAISTLNGIVKDLNKTLNPINIIKGIFK